MESSLPNFIEKVIAGIDSDPVIIAEVGQAHEGSLGMAHSFIDSVAKTGAHGIKFQTHYASEESSNFDRFRKNVFPQDSTRYDYWKRMEFTPNEWAALANHARNNGLEFLSSPFSNKAVKVLRDCGVRMWKIASGELKNYPMIDQILEFQQPLLISTGMAS